MKKEISPVVTTIVIIVVVGLGGILLWRGTSGPPPIPAPQEASHELTEEAIAAMPPEAQRQIREARGEAGAGVGGAQPPPTPEAGQQFDPRNQGN